MNAIFTDKEIEEWLVEEHPRLVKGWRVLKECEQLVKAIESRCAEKEALSNMSTAN